VIPASHCRFLALTVLLVVVVVVFYPSDVDRDGVDAAVQ
jgi:hypothetical protein